MQVVIAGATGFIGAEVVRQALAAGHQVFPMVRERKEAAFDSEDLKSGAVVPVPFGAPAEVMQAGFGLERGAWIVNAAGPMRDYRGRNSLEESRAIAESMVELAADNQARRLVHLSPLPCAGDPFSQAKAEGNRILRQAGLPLALLHCAPVYGPGDELLDPIGAWMMRSPFIPRFLEEVPLQPLSVADVAQVLLALPEGTFNLGGPRLTWGELLERCAEAAGKRLVGPRLAPETILRLARTLGDRGPFADLIPFTEAGFLRHAKGYALETNDAETLLGRPPGQVEDYLRNGWAYRA